MTKALVALGANLGNPRQQVIDALIALSRHPALDVLDVSSLYSSAPMGPQDQPNYINAVCVVDSALAAFDTLQLLHHIEDQFGRQRIRHWGERTLDLDLLVYGDTYSDDEAMRLPHPGLYEREFVLYPLAEIQSDWILPNGVSAIQQARQVPKNGLRVVFSRDDLLKTLTEGGQ
jgi:2-amino-4-hydroxy-6-hydroxymethyldihydropteridine diphosphokinase